MNICTKVFAIALSITVLISSCDGVSCIIGSGKQISETRDVDSFTKVEASGSIKVILKQGALNSLRIIADDNVMAEIDTYVRGSKLVIDIEKDFCEDSPVTVYITSAEYEGISASGAVEILGEGKLNVKDFEIDLSGNCKVMLDMNAGNVKTSSSGASEIILKGQAGSHELDLSGSSSVRALDFVVGKYRIESSGASDSHINVLNELAINSSGSSDIQYRGNPTSIKNDESGASSLKKID